MKGAFLVQTRDLLYAKRLRLQLTQAVQQFPSLAFSVLVFIVDPDSRQLQSAIGSSSFSFLMAYSHWMEAGMVVMSSADRDWTASSCSPIARLTRILQGSWRGPCGIDEDDDDVFFNLHHQG